MAKKKASAKKSNPQKSAKKAVKKSPQKPLKKAAPKKAAKKVTKAAPMKAAPKKAVAKKSAPKKAVSKKAAVKKSAVKVKAPVAKKASAVTKAPAVVAPKKMKITDLTDFVTPLDDRLIIQTVGAERMTAGGLYIPDTVSDVSGNLQGHVVAVGRGHQGKKGQVRPMDVKVGDKVVFAEFSGTKINIQNQDLIILREVDVLGVVE